ncbi:transposase [Proteus terrae]|uniref:transposase n=1 Tax=Proteus terrae TaxID=1574161 RepID=UPI00301D2818
MLNHTLEFKLEIIQAYLNDEGPPKILSKRFKINHAIIRLWIENYRLHGLGGLKVKTSKQVYSPEFKFHAVQMILNGTSLHEVRRRLDIRDRSRGCNQMAHYQQQLQERGLKQSMSRKGNYLQPIIKPVDTLYLLAFLSLFDISANNSYLLFNGL